MIEEVDTGSKRAYKPRKPRKAIKRSWKKKRASTGKIKPRGISKLKKEADRVFSLFVRQRFSDNAGEVSCYTCPFRAHWKKLQNGHLVSRYYLATRYDERNCRPQCITCNVWRNGMTPHFAAKLQEELGAGIVEELYKLARELRKNFDYQGIIDKYKALLQELEK